MKTLSNDRISITIEEHGAELSSIKCSGREYLWGAYPEFWKRHSPVLFPIVGSLWNGEMRSKGKTYKMGQHGFARDMDFTPISITSDEAWFKLESNDETLAKYPYRFILRIGYVLHGNTIDVCWEVENPSDEVMSFQIGAHPAFYWPMLSDKTIADGVEAMNKELAKTDDRGFFKLAPEKKEIVSALVAQSGGIDPSAAKTIAMDKGFLAIKPDMFDHDALVLENSQVNAVTICDSDRNPYITVKFDAPLVGLWSPPHKNAPFVCIEPWYGRADRHGYDGTFEEKEWTNTLNPGETFKTKYQIVIE